MQDNKQIRMAGLIRIETLPMLMFRYRDVSILTCTSLNNGRAFVVCFEG
jgi:hypothetical protein